MSYNCTLYYIHYRGRGWRSWLKNWSTSWKVAGSIPDDVIKIFHWHNPSGSPMALGLIQPLTEMNTRNISWGWRRPVRRADDLTTFMCQFSWILRVSASWNLKGLPRPVMELLFTFYIHYDGCNTPLVSQRIFYTNLQLTFHILLTAVTCLANVATRTWGKLLQKTGTSPSDLMFFQWTIFLKKKESVTSFLQRRMTHVGNISLEIYVYRIF